MKRSSGLAWGKTEEGMDRDKGEWRGECLTKKYQNAPCIVSGNSQTYFLNERKITQN